MRFKSLLLLALIASAGCTTTSASRSPPYRIIAYVYERADIDRIGAHKLTRINYAFGLVSTEGEVFLEDREAPGRIARLQALKARNPKLKIILSVGGWGADNFSDAALTEASREKFATSAVDRTEMDKLHVSSTGSTS